ncbi:MAG: EndoU domain-containing protein [Patescibacteria group bacterium]|nr:EndoU domain-containing protein [Patescibacteria group bacterium]
MAFITEKATNKELSIIMNRMKKNNGQPLYSEFASGSIRHFVEGEVKNGRASGFHHQGLSERGNAVAPGRANKHGILESGVLIDGIKKSGNSGMSTLFPEDWGIIKTLDAVSEAYHDPGRRLVPGTSNLYEGYTGKIKIGMYIDQNGKIKSAFPIL